MKLPWIDATCDTRLILSAIQIPWVVPLCDKPATPISKHYAGAREIPPEAGRASPTV